MEESQKGYFDSLEQDLRKKKDRSGELDDLFQFSFLGDDDVRERTSWCVAKMGQNKIQDMRILDILSSMSEDENPQVRENVAWGIGEVAGAGVGDDRSVSVINSLMGDAENSVRGMAAWAAGRLRYKLGIEDGIMLTTLRSLLDDRSVIVKRSAEFALEGKE